MELNPTVTDDAWLNRIEEAAKPVLERRRRKDVEYKFTILDSPVVNAFSTPGGYVYVSRGLMDFIGADEDYALQFAIGHEIAHVDLQHALTCLRDKGVMSLKMGTLQKLYLLIIPHGYLIDEEANVDQELEADAWIVNRMQALGRSRREILAFLRRFEGYAKSHGFAGGRVKADPKGPTLTLEDHYRSQTAAGRRLKQSEALMAKAAAASK